MLRILGATFLSFLGDGLSLNCVPELMQLGATGSAAEPHDLVVPGRRIVRDRSKGHGATVREARWRSAPAIPQTLPNPAGPPASKEEFHAHRPPPFSLSRRLAAAPRAHPSTPCRADRPRDRDERPASGACGYPDGPQNSSSSTAAGALPRRGQPGGLRAGRRRPAALMGDIAVDKAAGRGLRDRRREHRRLQGLDRRDPRQHPFAFLGIAPPLTGLGFDGNTGFLWMCNVAGYAARSPTAPARRSAARFTAAPAGVGALSDIDMDRHRPALVCDAGGNVAHFAPGAAVPANLIGVAGGLPCGVLGIPFTGCASTPARRRAPSS